MAFEMERSPAKIHLMKLKKPRGIDLNPPLIFAFQVLTGIA